LKRRDEETRKIGELKKSHFLPSQPEKDPDLPPLHLKFQRKPSQHRTINLPAQDDTIALHSRILCSLLNSLSSLLTNSIHLNTTSLTLLFSLPPLLCPLNPRTCTRLDRSLAPRLASPARTLHCFLSPICLAIDYGPGEPMESSFWVCIVALPQ
jgi:hypothetical protein